jgi:hypothetical protein
LKQSPSKQNLEITRRNWTKWSRAKLYENGDRNYDFSEFLKWKKIGAVAELADAWRVEIDRELGLDCEPFLTTWEKQHWRDPERTPPRGVRHIPNPNFSKISIGKDWPTQNELFEIDWTCPRKEIAESFRYWLENNNRMPSYALGNEKKSSGRKYQYHAWFKELSIYRCASAKVKRKGANILLENFLVNYEQIFHRGAEKLRPEISEFDWGHAIEKTEKRIYKRMIQLLCHTAMVKRGGLAKIEINDPWQKYLGKLR